MMKRKMLKLPDCLHPQFDKKNSDFMFLLTFNFITYYLSIYHLPFLFGGSCIFLELVNLPNAFSMSIEKIITLK